MDLLGTVNADASAEITRQHVRPPAMPLAGEEAMFKGLQKIGLEVVAPVAADPGPALQGIETSIGAVEGGLDGLSHGAG